MTAIALLNVENDPHLVADTLLSADGGDPRPSKFVWLPALGEIPSEWSSGNKTWHISRLGRKTFFLPNQSGILGFAGDCPAAFRFWAELSNAILTASAYDESFRVDKAMVERVLHSMPHDAMRFSLLGILVDASSRREVFAHNQHICLETKNFGTCYVCGSGSSLVREIIEQVDQVLTASRGWPVTYPISATEDLAEHISAAMLYKESDYRNGEAPGSPIGSYCGGFYEWYGIRPDGIRPMQSRVDLHVSAEEDKLTVTRAYFAEQMKLPAPNPSVLSSQRYYLSVLNLVLSPYVIPVDEILDNGYTIQLSECWGALVPPTFEVYDTPESARSPDRLYAQLNDEAIAHMFPAPHDIYRVRVIAGRGRSDRITKRFITHPDKTANAMLSAANGRLSLWVSGQVLEDTINTVRHLP